MKKIGFIFLLMSVFGTVFAETNINTASNSTSVQPATTDSNGLSASFKKNLAALPPSKYQFYVGGILGYGNTNWSQMVSQDGLSSQSTPTSASGSGLAGGLFAGYELTTYFAVEANWMRFPNAHLEFTTAQSQNTYGGISSLDSTTNEYSVMAKFMVPIGSPKWRAFSEVGPSYTQRDDDLAQKGHIGAGFGVGLDYNFSPRWMTELGFQYYTGYGVSETKPVYDYIPFLYTVNLRLAYRFSLF